MTALTAVAIGIVLAAAAGLRAFLPVFSASLAANLTDLPLPDYLGWLDRPDTLVLFGVATLLEILGDKIPIVDHALDAVQTISKPLLAALAATPFLYQVIPEHSVAIGLILGAPLALGVHTAKATTRVASTATTGGLANPFVSVAEDLAAAGAILIAFVAPIVALVLTAALIFLLARIALRVRGARTP